MTLDEFRKSITATQPPAGLTHALAGLWWDAKNDWTRAHESAQVDEGVDGSWVHAYLAPHTDGMKSSDDRPSCLENRRPAGAESTRTENAASPFHAEPRSICVQET